MAREGTVLAFCSRPHGNHVFLGYHHLWSLPRVHCQLYVTSATLLTRASMLPQEHSQGLHKNTWTNILLLFFPFPSVPCPSKTANKSSVGRFLQPLKQTASSICGLLPI
eukprot:20060_3